MSIVLFYVVNSTHLAPEPDKVNSKAVLQMRADISAPCGNTPIRLYCLSVNAHQSSGSQSLKPFAKGLLAIFSWVI